MVLSSCLVLVLNQSFTVPIVLASSIPIVRTEIISLRRFFKDTKDLVAFLPLLVYTIMLCEHCKRYIRRFEVAKPWQAGNMIHHSSSRSLKRALNQGCNMCRILYGSRMERLSSFTRSEAIWRRACGPNFALFLDIYTSKTPGSTLEPERIVSQLNRIFPRRGKVQLARSYCYSSLTSC